MDGALLGILMNPITLVLGQILSTAFAIGYTDPDSPTRLCLFLPSFQPLSCPQQMSPRVSIHVCGYRDRWRCANLLHEVHGCYSFE